MQTATAETLSGDDTIVKGLSQARVPPPTPTADTTWAVGQTISFSGSATDFQDGLLPASALKWDLILHHCPVDVNFCHEHPNQSWVGTAFGSFIAPDHDYPAYLELRFTSTDNDGFTATVSRVLQPRTVVLTFATKPKGLTLVVGGAEAQTASFSRTVIVGSRITISAPLTQTLAGTNLPIGACRALRLSTVSRVRRDLWIKVMGRRLA